MTARRDDLMDEQIEQDKETQKLQSTVDRAKTVSLLQNIHNLTPPTKKEEHEDNQVAIVKALESEPRLRAIFLEARGMIWDDKKKVTIQISKPFMNIDGAWKLVAILKKIAQESEFSNFHEDNIPVYMEHFYNREFPMFTFYSENYDLDPSNFDYVSTCIQMFLLGSFYKAKGGKMLNLLGRTYSEDMIGKIMNNESKKSQKEGFLDKLNPFKKV